MKYVNNNCIRLKSINLVLIIVITQRNEQRTRTLLRPQQKATTITELRSVRVLLPKLNFI